ncbi:MULTISPECIES: hypothetical protein [unclassified Streptomyces]|uniref:hypothetical protein n=1 Tax=unclassified Streptomyces TaxID=2593676 RepID=UPI0006AD8F30|nr:MULTISPECIES: hypothetical protein [unclassified Streptomyces]KOX21518.1 hypothetical protein ADL06_25630 [Streptomyces sp. NRRL F-6491]KOX39196.1 hypothetical protein ADL08_25895 [Streptomyces sp. NRRL F-6492]
MFEYEIDRMNHAQLVREAAARRLSREAAASAGREPRPGRRSGGRDAEGPVDDDGGPGGFVRAA